MAKDKPSRGGKSNGTQIKPGALPVAELRKEAERIAASHPEAVREISPEEIRTLIHELQVHQIELEMQNEELRRAQEQVEESRQRYADLYDFAPVGYFTLDNEGRITDANLTGASLLGIERGLLLRRPFPRFIMRESKDVFYLHRKKVIEDGTKESCELVMRRPDGTSFWASLESVATEIDGEQREIRSILTDITERRRAGAERLRLATTAMEHVVEGVVIRDREGRIQDVNQAFCRMSGYAREEVIGNSLTFLAAAPAERLFHDEVQPVVFRGEVWSGRLTNRRKDGRTYEVEATLAPVTDASGNLVNCIEIHHDITDKVLLEEQLRQAQKMEALGTLAGGIAHDFNNILAAIIWNAETALEDTPAGNPLHRRAEQILKAGIRGRDLVRQILTFSRKATPEKKPLQLSPVLAEAVSLLRASLPRTIDLKLRLEATYDTIFGDSSQIGQLVMNLVSNAAQAMSDKAGQRIEIALTDAEFPKDGPLPHPDMTPGRYVVLSVEDTGSGMSEEVKKRIFEPFFTTRKTGQGTGMGLAVVYGIAKGHKAVITVSSKPGEGSLFRIFFPCSNATSEAGEGAALPAPKGEGRILFIDDEEMLVEISRQVLEGIGYEVFATTDSDEALSRFVEDPSRFDLIITDQTMPKTTGTDLAERLHEVRPDIPVVLCTGYSETVSPETAKARGISQFIMKPASTTEIAEAVRKALQRKTNPNKS